MSRDTPTPTPTPTPTRGEWLLLGGIVLLALVLRLYRLGEQSLWWDDYNGVAHLTVQGFFASMAEARRMNPEGAPLYHVVQWFAAFVFGTGEYGQRLFNVLLSTGIVLVLHRLGRNALGPAAGLGAALLFALSPTHIYHAQSLRIYPLEVFLAALSLLAFERMLTVGGKRWERINVVCNGLLPLTHLFGLFGVIAQGVALLGLGRSRWPLLFRWSLLQGLCLIPMVLLVLAMPHRPAGAFWHFQPPGITEIVNDLLADDVHNPPGALVPGAAGRNQPWSFQFAGFDSHAPGTRLALDRALMAAFGLIAALAALRLARLLRAGRPEDEADDRERRALWVGLTYWAVPVLALVAVCYLWRPVMHARYTLYACLGLYLLAGHVAAVYLPGRFLRRAALAGLALLMGYQLLALLPINTRTEWRAVANDIAREAGPDDLVLVGAFGPPDINHRTLCYHLPEGFTLPVLTAGTPRWALEQIRCHLLRHGPEHPRPSVWFVYNTHFYLGDPEVFQSAFAENGLAFERRHYAGGETILLFRIADWPGIDPGAPLKPGNSMPPPNSTPFDVDHAMELLQLPLDPDAARAAISRAWDDGTVGEGRYAYLTGFRQAFSEAEDFALAEHCALQLLAESDQPDMMGELSYATMVLMPQYRWDAAAEAILRGAGGEPLPPEARVMLAVALRASGFDDLAREAYEPARGGVVQQLVPALPLLDAYLLGKPDDLAPAAFAVRRALYPHWYAGDAMLGRILGLPAWISPCREAFVAVPVTPARAEEIRARLAADAG